MRRKLLLSLLFLFSLDAAFSNDCGEYMEHPGPENILTLGRSHTFTCVPTGGRAFQWFKGTTSINNVRVDMCNCDSTSTTLTFRSFQPSDAGNFSCRINRGGGRFYICSFIITVPENPTVTLSENSSSVNEASQVTITPTINLGRPMGSFEWLYNGSLITSSDRRSINLNTGVLTITNVQRSDRGRYTIRVSSEHGNDSADYNLTVYFLERPELELVPEVNNRRQIRCSVTGQWDGTLDISWDPTPITISPNLPVSIDDFTRKKSQTAGVAANDCKEYTCTAMTASGASSTSPSLFSCSGPMVNAINVTAVTVSWTVRGGNTYRIRYGLVTAEISKRIVTEPLTSGSRVIRGLMAGMEYEFELGTIVGDEIQYSSPASTTLGQCPNNVQSPSSVVTDVQAKVVTKAEGRTVMLTWMKSSDTSVSGYRVNVFSDPFQSQIVNEPFFVLDPAYCNGNTYTYSVEAVNMCNLGSNAITVTQKCSTIGGAQIHFSVDKAGDTSLTFNILVNQSRVNSNTPVKIIVSRLLPTADGFGETREYEMPAFANSVCLGGLSKNTAYNVCLCTDFVNGISNGNEKICIQGTTSDRNTDPASCLSTDKITTEKAIGGRQSFPDWAIAVIVVGILAVVALVFCFIGVYYACSSNKSKDYIYGSTPSLQASSVNMQHNMHNPHRSTSPPRSCLSYHVKGHSTNWNEHSDTLRQMETDKGTHV